MASPEGFEEKVKQLIAAHGREQAAVKRTDNTVNFCATSPVWLTQETV